MCCGLDAKCLNYVKKLNKYAIRFSLFGIKRSIIPSAHGHFDNVFNTFVYRWYRVRNLFNVYRWCIPAFTFLSAGNAKKFTWMPSCRTTKQSLWHNLTHLYTIFTLVFYAIHKAKIRRKFIVWTWSIECGVWHQMCKMNENYVVVYTFRTICREEKPKDKKVKSIFIHIPFDSTALSAVLRQCVYQHITLNW